MNAGRGQRRLRLDGGDSTVPSDHMRASVGSQKVHVMILPVTFQLSGDLRRDFIFIVGGRFRDRFDDEKFDAGHGTLIELAEKNSCGVSPVRPHQCLHPSYDFLADEDLSASAVRWLKRRNDVVRVA